MNNCKHFDLDNAGNSICKLGGTCDTSEKCTLKETRTKENF